jgi:DNA-binding protein HU-beta
MTKADLVQEISKQTGIGRDEVLMIVESFMETVKGSLSRGKEVYLRGFGSFIIKRRAEKTGRNIGQNTTLIIPAHDIPAFKPSKEFSNKIKKQE